MERLRLTVTKVDSPAALELLQVWRLFPAREVPLNAAAKLFPRWVLVSTHMRLYLVGAEVQ